MNPLVRVLILEDCKADAELMALALREAGIRPEWKRVDTAQGFRTALSESWDLIISDYSLPQFDALSALNILREIGSTTPVIVVTGSVEERAAVECIRHGAADYLLKDRLARLPSAAAHALEERKIRDENIRAHRALVESERRSRALIENSSDGILMLNRLGMVIRRCRDLAEPGAACLGEAFLEWMIAEDRPGVACKWDRLAEGPQTMQFRVPCSEGRYRWVEAHCQDLYEEEGVNSIVLHYRDITERMRAQEEIESAKEAAEAASCAKSEFLAAMSHEVRTPMNGILPIVELLRLTALSAEQREYLDTIHRSAGSLLTMLNDILQFSRIEAERIELDSVSFNLRSLSAEVVERMAAAAAQRGLGLTASYAHGAPEDFIGDPGRIRQVIHNLAGNGIKFTERGHVAIRVTCESEKQGVALMRVTVKDTGIGIPEGKEQAIFENFTQADRSNTRRYDGAGLGLAVARRLVLLMNGEIGVTSQIGEGSAFWFTLPLRQRDRVSRDLEQRRDPAATSGPMVSANSDARKWMVLVAEDNLVNQKVISRLLEKLNCQVRIAPNGRRALELIDECVFDVIFMDCQMPVMDGYGATEAIRRQQGSSGHTPIIAVTASALEGDKERCLQSGMDDYIAKPVNLSILNATLERWLKISREQI